jgi:hypothetical protein
MQSDEIVPYAQLCATSALPAPDERSTTTLGRFALEAGEAPQNRAPVAA